jgi:hypothetical protein
MDIYLVLKRRLTAGDEDLYRILSRILSTIVSWFINYDHGSAMVVK